MSTSPKVSIVIATYNQREFLAPVLDSIALQRPSFEFETIVVDDGSDDGTGDLDWSQRNVRYVRLDRPGYLNPAVPRNVGYKMARGEIIISQAADVIHARGDTIERLAEIEPGEFLVATVCNVVNGVRQLKCYASPDRPRPRLFLGSLWRKDIFRVGGNDEDFTEAGFDDDYLAACLESHGIQARYTWEIIGHHQHHARPENLSTEIYPRMREVFVKKMAAGPPYVASGGPWPLGDVGHWAQAHERKDSYWLAGTGGPTVANKHGLRDLTDGSPIRFMDVGVGLGKMAAWLKSRGHYVIAVDAVPEALAEIEADESHLTAELCCVPPMNVDVACAHIVFQHLNDGEAIELIAGVLRHLKPGGFFAADFAVPIENPKDPEWIGHMREHGLLHLRSQADIKRLAKMAGAGTIRIGHQDQLSNCAAQYCRITP